MTAPRRRVCVGALILLGLGLRLWAFQWNDRLQGDVNLHALTARSFVATGELRYPLKYEYSDVVEYCDPTSMASQHPPLFPLAAGVLGRLLGTDETFPLLKALSMVGGVLLVLAFAARAHAGGAGGLFALALVCVSPSLVDFSANGSPYSWIGLLLLLSVLAIGRARDASISACAFAGLVAGLAPQIHTSLAAIPVGFVAVGLAERRHLRWSGVAWFFAMAGATAAPYFAWNTIHFGSPIYSYNPHVLWTNLGLGQEGIYGDVVTWRGGPASWSAAALQTLETAAAGSVETLLAWVRDGGPIAGLFAAVGLATRLRSAPRRTLQQLLPVALYLGLVLIHHFRDRFAVPLLPLFYLAAAVGFDRAWNAGDRKITLAAAATAALSIVPAYFEDPPTRYYARDARHRDAYEAMVPMARQLALKPRGATLGLSGNLDGGLESVYHHRQPFVRGLSHGPAREPHPGAMVRKLARDFYVRYLWTDASRRAWVERTFPEAHPIASNESFMILEIPAHRRGHSTSCPPRDSSK